MERESDRTYNCVLFFYFESSIFLIVSNGNTHLNIKWGSTLVWGYNNKSIVDRELHYITTSNKSQ